MSAFNFNKYCIEKLFNDIPEIFLLTGRLKEKLDQYLIDDFGAHLVYEDIFTFMVLNLINKTNGTKDEQELIDRSFRLIEDLAQHEEFEVRCVAEVSFLEPLLAELKPTRRILDYVLPKSLELAQHVGQFVFGFNPHTWEKEE